MCLGRVFLRCMSTGKKRIPLPRSEKSMKSLINDNVPLMSNPFAVNLNHPRELSGRDLISFETMNTEEIYSILWIALDLKQRGKVPKLCDGKIVGVVSSNPVRRLSLSSAGTRLGAATTAINPSEILNSSMDFEILGKTIGAACDAVVFDSCDIRQSDLEEFATGCTTPTLSVESSLLCPIYGLSELFTLYEHYKYLRRVTVAFVGDAESSLINTYAVLFPKVGMHLHYFMSGDIAAPVWETSIRLSTEFRTEIKQFDNFVDALYRVHTLSVTPAQNADSFIPEILLSHTEEMDLDWTILHKDVHLQNSPLSRDLLRCQQSLIWKNILNLQWVFMATLIATATTHKYSPSIRLPPFEGRP